MMKNQFVVRTSVLSFSPQSIRTKFLTTNKFYDSLTYRIISTSVPFCTNRYNSSTSLFSNGTQPKVQLDLFLIIIRISRYTVNPDFVTYTVAPPNCTILFSFDMFSPRLLGWIIQPQKL